MPRCSRPNWTLWLYPRFASSPTPSELMPYSPTSTQLEDLLTLNKLPLDTAQSGGTEPNTAIVHASSAKGTSVSGEAVETSTLRYCSGSPTRTSKVLHGPSFPSLQSLSAIISHQSTPRGLTTNIGSQGSQEALVHPPRPNLRRVQMRRLSLLDASLAISSLS